MTRLLKPIHAVLSEANVIPNPVHTIRNEAKYYSKPCKYRPG